MTDVEIDHYGSLKDWINEALDEQYWNVLLKCLLDREAQIPEQKDTWTRRRRSPRNHEGADVNNHSRLLPPELNEKETVTISNHHHHPGNAEFRHEGAERHRTRIEIGSKKMLGKYFTTLSRS